VFLLEPFSGDAAGALLDNLAGAPLSPELRRRILATAEGNPLFIEETVAMLAETGDAEVAVPPTISALLAARIDQLRAEQRRTLECGSIEGEVFHRRAVEALSDEKQGVVAQLAGLVRKELVRREVPVVAGDDAFRFRHGLIRDAAYEALPKARRAALHERFAEWLAVARPDLVELDELLGYHLEQAYRFRRELGVTGDETTRPARQAGAHLAAAGRIALARGDVPAAVSLLSRATTLLPAGDELRRGLLPELADALSHQGKLDEAAKVVAEALELSAAAGDQHVEAQARLLDLSLLAFRQELVPEEDGLPGASVLRDAIVVARGIADDARHRADAQVEAAALGVVARSTLFLGRAAEAEEVAADAHELAVRAGDRKLQDEIRSWWVVAKVHGPAPVADGIAFCAEACRSPNLQLRTFGALFGALLKAMAGEIDTARAESDQALAVFEEFGLELLRGGGAISRGQIEVLVGDVNAAERELRYGWDLLGALGETGFRATVGGLLAQTLLLQDRLDEADALLTELGAFVHRDDIEPQMRRRAVRAGILARRGAAEDAVAVAREAVRLAEQTDYDLRADALVALADVLALSGSRDEAAAAVEQAFTLHEQKGNVVGAAAAKRLLEELQAPEPASR
jgi:tetratricopeptide (TPR) repeat protein